MSDKQMLLAVVVIAVVTAFTRFAPFVLFAGRKTPSWVNYLGKVLPGAVMGMLVVYCLRGVHLDVPGGFVPELVAGAVTVVSYVFKRNTLVSILAGTVCYMLLVQLVFV